MIMMMIITVLIIMIAIKKITATTTTIITIITAVNTSLIFQNYSEVAINIVFIIVHSAKIILFKSVVVRVGVQ